MTINTRRYGFRAKITPDSNEDAITELRREMKVSRNLTRAQLLSHFIIIIVAWIYNYSKTKLFQ